MRFVSILCAIIMVATVFSAVVTNTSAEKNDKEATEEQTLPLLEEWHYRIPITVNAEDYDRKDYVLAYIINIEEEIGGFGTFDRNSVRVIETDEEGIPLWESITQIESRLPMMKGDDSLAITWVMNGTTPTYTKRFYNIYFDVLENGPKTAPKYGEELVKFEENEKQMLIEGNNYKIKIDKDRGGSRLVKFNDVPRKGFVYDQTWQSWRSESLNWKIKGAETKIVEDGPIYKKVKIVSSDEGQTLDWYFYPDRMKIVFEGEGSIAFDTIADELLNVKGMLVWDDYLSENLTKDYKEYSSMCNYFYILDPVLKSANDDVSGRSGFWANTIDGETQTIINAGEKGTRWILGGKEAWFGFAKNERIREFVLGSQIPPTITRGMGIVKMEKPVISKNITLSNQLIHVKGNLTVETGGNLRLEHVNLSVKGNITVKTGGKLSILASMDSTYILEGFGYVEEGGEFTLENSMLYIASLEDGGGGLIIYGKFNVLSSKILPFSGTYEGTHYLPRYWIFYTVGAEMKCINSTIYKLWAYPENDLVGGIIIVDGDNVEIDNSHIEQSQGTGICIASGKPKVTNNYVTDCKYGILYYNPEKTESDSLSSTLSTGEIPPASSTSGVFVNSELSSDNGIPSTEENSAAPQSNSTNSSAIVEAIEIIYGDGYKTILFSDGSTLTLPYQPISLSSTNLLLNGDFSQNLNYWEFCYDCYGIGSWRGEVVYDSTNYPHVFEHERWDSHASGGKVTIYQELNIDVSLYSSIYLELDTKVISNWLGNSGLCSYYYGGDGEYPCMVWIRYKDEYDKTWYWSHGFLPCIDYWGRADYDIVVKNEWYHYQSPNLLGISTTWTDPYNQPIFSPPPKKITGIFLGGKGWDWIGRFANVKLLGEEIAVNQPPVAVISEYHIVAEIGKIFSDDFEDGDAAGWQEFDGTGWYVANGVYYSPSAPKNAYSLAGSLSWTDYTLEVKMGHISGEKCFGIIGRFPDGPPAYKVYLWANGPDGAGVYIYEYTTAGLQVKRAFTSFSVTSNIWYLVKATFKGYRMDAEVTNIATGSKVTLSSYVSGTHGRIGLLAHSAHVAFDDVIVTGAPTVSLDGSNSYDPDGAIIKYSWDFDASNGIQEDAIGITTSASYASAGIYFVTLTVTDDKGATDTDYVRVTVWNSSAYTISDNTIYGCERGIILALTDKNAGPVNVRNCTIGDAYVALYIYTTTPPTKPPAVVDTYFFENSYDLVYYTELDYPQSIKFLPIRTSYDRLKTIIFIEAGYSDDADNDGWINELELYFYGFNPYYIDDPTSDFDEDGLTNVYEVENFGTDALSCDTDNDGATDWDELMVYYTCAQFPDTDWDGLLDGYELFTLYPYSETDWDNDGIIDYTTNPFHPYTDSDALTDKEEIDYGTNPLDPDCDDDGLSDSYEILTLYEVVYASIDHPKIKDYLSCHAWIYKVEVYGEIVYASVEVGIKHTYIGDLEIILARFLDGLGEGARLWNRGGGTTDNLYIERDLLRTNPEIPDFPYQYSEADFRMGYRWYLEINDWAEYDEGELEYFRIKVTGRTDPLNSDTDGDGIGDHEEVIRGSSPLRPNVLNWGMCIHRGDIITDAKRNKALDQLVELGVAYIRIDFEWPAIEPHRDSINFEVIRWYASLIKASREKGISIIAVLRGHPAWAQDLYFIDKNAFWEEWKEFCEYISWTYGYDIYYYQISNEENHPLNGDLVADGKFLRGDEDTAFKIAYEGVARYDSSFETIVNVYADWPDWAKRLEEWSSGIAKDYIDILAIDHYPGTWTWTDFADWGPLDSLIGICNKYNKKGAIMETGYSTYNDSVGHGRDEQEAFINTALPIIKSKSSTQNVDNPNNRVLLCCWYELYDENTGGGGWIDYHCGICATDGTPKEAYDNLRDKILEFYVVP